EPRVERVAVISAVTNKAIGCSPEKTCIEGVFDERDLSWRSTRDPGADWKTMPVCHCHDLAPLPALGLPDARAPFLAPTKVPSMKASVRSSPPRLWRCSASAWSTRCNVPSQHHCWKRRWQVW